MLSERTLSHVMGLGKNGTSKKMESGVYTLYPTHLEED